MANNPMAQEVSTNRREGARCYLRTDFLAERRQLMEQCCPTCHWISLRAQIGTADDCAGGAPERH